MTADTVSGALDEMEWLPPDDDYPLDIAASVPAQLRFTETPTQNTRRFHVELGRRGYSPLDANPDRRNASVPEGPYYDGEICSREHYNRMRILIFRGEVLRLYPKDAWDVTEDELAAIIDAIEVSFAARVAHDPIERATPQEDSEQ